MYLYYGTNLETALSILTNRQIKGKKAYHKHHNRYVSFSKNKYEARQFGEVVLRFENVQNGVSVELENADWILNNQEMTEFVLNKKNHSFLLDEQIILKNKLDFNNQSVTIYLIHDDKKILNDMKNEITPLLKVGDKVTKNIKMYTDFQEWKEKKHQH